MTVFNVKGDIWKVFLHDEDSEEKFVRKHGDQSAVTDLDKREIHFLESELDIITVRHEILHIYIHYLFLYVRPARLRESQKEEAYAEMFAIDGPMILKQANKIYSILRNQ